MYNIRQTKYAEMRLLLHYTTWRGKEKEMGKYIQPERIKFTQRIGHKTTMFYCSQKRIELNI